MTCLFFRRARRADQASLLTSPAEVGGVNGLVCEVDAVAVFAALALPPGCPPDWLRGLEYDCSVAADDAAPEAPEQELMSFLSVVGGTIEGRGYRLVSALQSTAFNKRRGTKS
jgi:hypothetical protein